MVQQGCKLMKCIYEAHLAVRKLCMQLQGCQPVNSMFDVFLANPFAAASALLALYMFWQQQAIAAAAPAEQLCNGASHNAA
jgi:hypothetical protein